MKKLLLSFGFAAAVVAPVSLVIACGSNNDLTKNPFTDNKNVTTVRFYSTKSKIELFKITQSEVAMAAKKSSDLFELLGMPKASFRAIDGSTYVWNAQELTLTYKKIVHDITYGSVVMLTPTAMQEMIVPISELELKTIGTDFLDRVNKHFDSDGKSIDKLTNEQIAFVVAQLKTRGVFIGNGEDTLKVELANKTLDDIATLNIGKWFAINVQSNKPNPYVEVPANVALISTISELDSNYGIDLTKANGDEVKGLNGETIISNVKFNEQNGILSFTHGVGDNKLIVSLHIVFK